MAIAYVISTKIETATKKSGNGTYEYLSLELITEAGAKKTEKIFGFADSEKDFNLLRTCRKSDKIQIDYKKEGNYFNYVKGSIKFLEAGNGTIPVSEKPKGSYSQKGSYNDPEEQKQLTFVWAIHNATEYIRMAEERMEKKLDRDKFEKLKIKLFMEAYSFPSPKIGRSFISAAIPLYKDEELKNIDAVIERARAFHREYVTISQDIKTPEREEAPTQNQSQPNYEPIPEQTDEELPF